VTYSDRMRIQLEHVCELVRYPVKSMAGTPTESHFSVLVSMAIGASLSGAWETTAASGLAQATSLPPPIPPFRSRRGFGEPLPTRVRARRNKRRAAKRGAQNGLPSVAAAALS
jgi:hypothetical protein